MSTATLDSETVPIPDEVPPSSGDYDPQYPGSTPDAPYGFKDDGSPYRRRPRGTASGSAKPSSDRGRMPASEHQAKTASELLASANTLVGISLMTFGLEQTALGINEANNRFRELAYEALLADPALCRKILSVGATGGKIGLITAYANLGLNIYPVMRQELKERKAARLEATDQGETE